MPKSRHSLSSHEKRATLDRALSKLGYCSRSQAAQLILSGQVTVNNRIERRPNCWIRLEKDRIETAGCAINKAQNIYLAFNKPRGIITTALDEKGRRTVYHFLANNSLPWIVPVGRLDKASEGLLLFTNDHEWADLILNPAAHVPKTYHVQISGHFHPDICRNLTSGIISEHERLTANSAKLLREGSKNCWLEIVLSEGKNREIRRMLEQQNREILRLIRVAIGPLSLGTIPKGQYRILTPQEAHDIIENKKLLIQ